MKNCVILGHNLTRAEAASYLVLLVQGRAGRNLIAFCASARGLLESSADTWYSLSPVAPTLASAKEIIVQALEGRLDSLLLALFTRFLNHRSVLLRHFCKLLRSVGAISLSGIGTSQLEQRSYLPAIQRSRNLVQ